MRNMKDNGPGAYVCIFENGKVPHEVAMYAPMDVIPPIPFLPWPAVETASLTNVAKAMWAYQPVMGIKVSLDQAKVDTLIELFAKGYTYLAGRAACAKIGLLRGGGIPYGQFSSVPTIHGCI